MNVAGDARIRSMGIEDLPRVIEIERALKHAPHWTQAAWEAVVDPNAAVRRIALVAEEPNAGEALGFAVAALAKPEAELESIAVAAPAQRCGLGRRLVAALAEELLHAGVGEVFLEVRASNRAALGFYAALGLTEIGRRARYYADPEEDAVLMGLRLR